MRTLLMMMMAAALVFAASRAEAGLVITASDNGSPIALATTLSGPGVLNTSGSDSAFSSITIDSVGVPTVPSPALGSTTLDVRHIGPGSNTLLIDVDQTGLTAPAGFKSETTMTVNGLIGSPGPSTLAMLVNGVILNSNTFPATGATATKEFFETIATPISSNEEQYSIVFSGLQSAQDTIAFIAAPANEPGALALLGMALLMLGMVMRRRRSADLA